MADEARRLEPLPARRDGPPPSGTPRRWLRNGAATLLLAGFLVLSWSGVAERAATAGIDTTLTRALATWAIARGLNGIISVAQGTEIAIQPVGVGVTLTPGEILDPLNDLVERFSWLAMLAVASLGTQALLTEMLANPWLSWLLTATAAGYAVSLWWPRPFAARGLLLRLCLIAIFARFLFAAVTLASVWIDAALLAERQEAAMARMQAATDRIEAIGDALPAEPEALPPAPTDGLLERFGDLWDDAARSLDVERQLRTLQLRAEAAIAEVVNLMVLFVVQTLVLPIAGLLLAYWGFKWLWRWTWNPSASTLQTPT